MKFKSTGIGKFDCESLPVPATLLVAGTGNLNLKSLAAPAVDVLILADYGNASTAAAMATCAPY